MESIITLPTGAVGDIVENIGILFSDLWVVIAIVIGIPLAFYLIRKLIQLFPKR